jgi:ketosteroid isomerase-like protein
MRRLIALSGALLLGVPLLMGSPGDKDADSSQAVINLENAWNQAEARHDASALKLLLAETFVYTDYDGSVAERDEWLKKIQSEAKDYRNLANVEQTARVYGGDTVVVNGIYVEKLTIKGRNVDRRVRFTDTWILQNSHWRCVASQSTLIAGS